MKERTPAGFLKNPRLYGRLGTKKILKEKLAECKSAGAKITTDYTESYSASATFEGVTIISALEKGEGVWLIMYNPEFYPKP